MINNPNCTILITPVREHREIVKNSLSYIYIIIK